MAKPVQKTTRKFELAYNLMWNLGPLVSYIMYTTQVPAKEKKRKSGGGATNGRKVNIELIIANTRQA